MSKNKEILIFLANQSTQVLSGSNEKDCIGLNSYDARWVKESSILSKENLEEWEEWKIYNVIKKYSRQIENAGMVIQEKREPRSKGKIDYSEQLKKFLVSFPFSNETLALFKNTVKEGREFDKINRNKWFVELSSFKYLPELISENFIITELAEYKLEDLKNQVASGKEIKKENSRMIKFEKEFEQFLIFFQGETRENFQELYQEVKNAPASYFDGTRKCWKFPVKHPDNIHFLIAFCKQYDFSLDKETKAMFDASEAQEAIKKENIELSAKKESSLQVDGLKLPLMPFQKAGVEYACKQGNVLIADEMGLGKTAQAIATVMHKDLFPCLVVCPASLKLNWRNEVQKWTNKSWELMNGKKDFDIKDFCIINYDNISKKKEELQKIPFKSVIFDESHYAKNQKASRSKVAKEIADGIPTKICLTGTPILNRPIELAQQLNILGRLDEFSGWFNFVKRYCKAHKTRFGMDVSGADNLKELNEKLRATCMVRRLKKDVLTELPEKQRQVVPIEIDNSKEYAKAEIEAIAYLKELLGKEDGGRNSQAEQLVRIELLKQLSANGKMESVFSWIEDFLESGEKLVFFATHKEIISKISEKFSCDSITGDTKLEDRQKFVEEFQNNPEKKLIVLNIQAGGVGLTLTAASHLAFCELGWNPGVHNQAEDRIHRISQKNNCNIYYLLSEKTIDQKIYNLIESKRNVVNLATDGKENVEEKEQVSILNAIVQDLVSR